MNEFSPSESKRKGRILINAIWGVVAFITTTFGIAIFTLPENSFRYIFIILVVWIFSMSLLLLAKKGHIRLSALLYIGFLVVMIFGGAWTGGGMKGHSLKILPVVVLFAALILEKKGIWQFTILTSLLGLGLVFGEYFQLLPRTEPLGQSPVIYWMYTTECIIIVAFLAYLAVKELRKSLKEAQEELALRRKAEELLRIQNKKLVEIAFLQAHMVRRPVASILGLISLVNFNNANDPENLEVIPKLEGAIKEFDASIKEIVDKTTEIEAVTQEIPESKAG